MDGMIENVARALWEQYMTTPRSWEEARTYEKEKLYADAKAAVAAMRDCSQGMRIAGHAALDASEASEPGIGSKIGFGALGDAWRAMIDDALSR